MSTFERAIAIAVQAHAGQLDKAGEPYVLHPLRVMFRMTSMDERIVAVLHDVVEDSEWTLQGLQQEGFSHEVVTAVDALTRRDGESYEDFVRRAGANPLARRVKLADLEDNMDMTRIVAPKAGDTSRFERYRRAYALLEVM